MTLVEKHRMLPISGEILVTEGDEVTYDTIVARTHVPGDVEMIPVFNILGVEPEDMPKAMLKKEGDAVQEGELIGLSKSFFGLFTSEYRSKFSGTIELISSITGMIGIRMSPVPINLNAYISGKVTKTIPRQGVVIETEASLIQGIFGVGGERHGEILVIADRDELLTPDHINKECAGKVLVGGSRVTSEVLKKAEKQGVNGIVTGSISRMELTRFLGYELGVAITGHEEIGLTCIITEGFGRMNLASYTYDLLKSCEGKIASINGATQIRAGVIRPEIIVPVNESKEFSKADDVLAEGMYPGTRVRVIRQPYRGTIGKVYTLPVELQEVETESRVRVMTVLLDDGEVITIPRANAEILEE